jgi:hypothetical protein
MLSDTQTDAYLSPEFPRGGLAAVFTVETTHLKGNPTLVVKVEHRNEDETSWATAGTFSNITTKTVTTLDVSTIKEIVRLSFEYSAGVAGDFFHVIVPAPAWRPY